METTFWGQALMFIVQVEEADIKQEAIQIILFNCLIKVCRQITIMLIAVVINKIVIISKSNKHLIKIYRQ